MSPAEPQSKSIKGHTQHSCSSGCSVRGPFASQPSSPGVAHRFEVPNSRFVVECSCPLAGSAGARSGRKSKAIATSLLVRHCVQSMVLRSLSMAARPGSIAVGFGQELAKSWDQTICSLRRGSVVVNADHVGYSLILWFKHHRYDRAGKITRNLLPCLRIR